ncbi:hypothetical protein TALC_00953 [Thermoplasmatales archaeon BRNA1]|nr:hypothetical protein TALC_00953 [Thermoplasmatales archaeon BRNA1]
MAEITPGTWFAYQFTETVGGRVTRETVIERFTIKAIEGDRVTVVRDINNADQTEIESDTSCGCYVFDISDFEKRGSDNMSTQFGHVYVSIMEAEHDGVSERAFVGKDNIVFRMIRTDHTPSGLHTETHELCWSNYKI